MDCVEAGGEREREREMRRHEHVCTAVMYVYYTATKAFFFFPRVSPRARCWLFHLFPACLIPFLIRPSSRGRERARVWNESHQIESQGKGRDLLWALPEPGHGRGGNKRKQPSGHSSNSSSSKRGALRQNWFSSTLLLSLTVSSSVVSLSFSLSEGRGIKRPGNKS